MERIVSFLIALASAVHALNPPRDLLVEYLSSPALGVESSAPRFSWSLQAADRGVLSSAYQIVVWKDEGSAGKIVWDSSNVTSARSTQVEYAGEALESDRSYYWKVRWSSSGGVWSEWSDAARFDTGLLEQSDWQDAQWLTCGLAAHAYPSATARECNFVRAEFALPVGNVSRARAYFSSMGWADLHVNGEKASKSVALEPGWSQWEARMLYSVYDVTASVKSGSANAVGAALGKGWPGHLGHTPTVKILLSVDMQDGRRIQISTKQDTRTPIWKGADGPRIANDIYTGEVYNATIAQQRLGWDLPGFDDSTWTVASDPQDKLLNTTVMSAQLMPPIRTYELIDPVDKFQPAGAPDDLVLDFGQNIAGWVRLELEHCPRGTALTLRHAEVLCGRGPTTWSPACSPAETVDQRNLLGANGHDIYICRGGAFEDYEPRFTYHGFRFVQIGGLPPAMQAQMMANEAVQARVVHSDVYFPTFAEGRTSKVTPGNIQFFGPQSDLLNRIQRNIQWTQRDNLYSVPTDCDQRSERQGWMADASVSSEEAIHNFWMAPLYSNWLRTMRDVQLMVARDADCDPKSPTYPHCDGTVADTIPHPPGTYGKRPADPSWGFAYPLIFENVRRYYGDERLLHELYPGIKAYVDWEVRAASLNPAKILLFHYYGDWLEPGRVPSEEAVSQMSTVFNFLQSIRIVRDAAHALGKQDDADNYQKLFLDGSAAYHTYFFNSTTRMYEAHGGGACELQPALVYPLYLGLVPDADLDAELFKRLLHDIRVTKGGHVSTGIIATKWLFELLANRGEAGLGLDLCLQTTFPSWGYMVSQNATTVWEHWEYMNGPGMNSHNHPAFASVGSWFYRHIGGLRLGEQPAKCGDPEVQFAGGGYRYIIIGPRAVNDPRVTGVSSHVQSLFGLIETSWHMWTSDGDASEARLSISASIPANTKAEVRFPVLPNLDAWDMMISERGNVVFEKGVYFQDAPTGVIGACIGSEPWGATVIVIQIGSGVYNFEARAGLKPRMFV